VFWGCVGCFSSSVHALMWYPQPRVMPCMESIFMGLRITGIWVWRSPMSPPGLSMREASLMIW